MMNSGEWNIFFNFPGYYSHGVPANYCYTNESSLVQNNSKNEEATKEEPKQKAMREEMVNERNRSVCVCMEGDI